MDPTLVAQQTRIPRPAESSSGLRDPEGFGTITIQDLRVTSDSGCLGLGIRSDALAHSPTTRL